jgi:hypothetical protein
MDTIERGPVRRLLPVAAWSRASLKVVFCVGLVFCPRRTDVLLAGWWTFMKPDLLSGGAAVLFGSIIRPLVDDPANATAWIRHIALAARDDVHMSVLDCLSLSKPIVHARVEPSGFIPVSSRFRTSATRDHTADCSSALSS